MTHSHPIAHGPSLGAPWRVAALLWGLLLSPPVAAQPASGDWLLGQAVARAAVHHDPQRRELTIGNGLISRTIRIAPNAATVAFDNLTTRESLLRAVAPEAEVEIDGRRYAIGGLVGQPNLAYLRPDWVEALDLGARSVPVRTVRDRHTC